MRRMHMKRVIPLLILILLLPAALIAQSGEPYAILAYYEDDTQIEVLDTEKTPVGVYFGMTLQQGDTVRTNGTVAELQLDPNGSIIKLSENTVFTIDQLQRSPETSNNFSLTAGRIRAIASSAGLGNRYQVSTPSAVCGVRGTDFGIIAGDAIEQVFVNSGVVEFVKMATQESLTLTQGMAADALAAVFEAIQLSQEQLQQLVESMQFEELNPTSVPGHEVSAPPQEDQEDEGEPEPEDGEGETPDEGTIPAAGGEEADYVQAKDGGESVLMGAIGEMLGFEIGTITIDGDTWSKAVIKPRFQFGKMKLGLYLPIVYRDDLFNRDQWYTPEGNDEWSFGTDYDWQDDPAEAFGDALVDLSLKIHYLEWGEQRDPFYLKLGNLHNMTLGHGTIMKNFANDLDFPAVRRTGINLGIDGKKMGFEAVVNDFAQPEIFGGRFYFRPVGRFALGATSVLDIDPLGKADGPVQASIDSMSFLAFGLDAELPIFENDVISIIPFADAAAMVPEKDGTMQWDILYDDTAGSFGDSFRNYGLTTGIFGNVLFVDYNLEFRYYNGIFRPTFFGPTYERIRGTLAANTDEYLTYLETGSGSSDYDETVMGIYGGAHTVLLGIADISAGYMWPWRSYDDLDDPTAFNDEFNLSLYLLPEVAKVIKVYGGIQYYRTNFLPAFWSDELSLFDSYSMLMGEIVYPIEPLEIALIVATTVKHDSEGNIVYDSNGNPERIPSVTIETRIKF